MPEPELRWPDELWVEVDEDGVAEINWEEDGPPPGDFRTYVPASPQPDKKAELLAEFKNQFWVALRPLISETGKVGASTLGHALDLAEEALKENPDAH